MQNPLISLYEIRSSHHLNSPLTSSILLLIGYNIFRDPSKTPCNLPATPPSTPVQSLGVATHQPSRIDAYAISNSFHDISLSLPVFHSLSILSSLFVEMSIHTIFTPVFPHLPHSLCICLSLYHFLNLGSIYLCLSVCLCVCLSTWSSTRQRLAPSNISLCLSVSLSVCLYICLSVLSVCQSLPFCLSR